MLNLKFRNVKIQGFLSIKSAEYGIAPGAFVIRGVNLYDDKKVSNGSGKSSLAEAVVWALTGQTARGLTGKKVVNTQIGSCEVTLELDVNGVHYRIVRGIDGSKNHLHIYDMAQPEKDLGLGFNKSKSILADVLGVDPEVFVPLVFFMERMPNRFSSYAPKDRKAMIEELANSDLIGRLDEATKAVIAEMTEDVTNVVGQVNLLSGQVQLLQGQVQSIKTVWAGTNRTDVMTQVATYETEANQLAAVPKQSQETVSKRNSLSQVWSTLSNNKMSLAKEQAELQRHHGSLSQSVCPYCHQQWASALEALPQVEARLSEISVTLPVVEDKLSRVTGEIQTLDQQIQTLNQSLQRMNGVHTQINTLKNQLAGLDVLEQREIEVSRLLLQLSEAQDEHFKITKKAEGYYQLAKALAKDLRNIAIAAYLEVLQSILTYYAEFLSMDVKLDIGKTNVDIVYGDRTYEQLSNGESRAVDIILQTAFRELMGIKSNLIVYDEIFDGLDPVASDAVIDLIQGLMGEDDSMFVISHAAHVSIPGAETMTVTKQVDGFSYLGGERGDGLGS